MLLKIIYSFGYKPVVIGVIFNKDIPSDQLKNAEINFIEQGSGKTIARLKLQLCSVHLSSEKNLGIYECVSGSHNFINPLQKQMSLLHQRFQKKKMGNVNLPGNLYEQVKIAYSVPRKICLITVCDGGMYNMFPTDLHGRIDDENYVISLRSDGKANAQVNKFKKITLSKMNLSRYKYVYSLGKNHMQEPKPIENFEMTENSSEKYNLPLPTGGIEYLELEHKEALTVGIHNLNFFKIINSKVINETEPVLSHVHRTYISWLLKKGYDVNYLLR